MAINERVCTQREITIGAWGSERYAEEEKKCWDIIEEEALKDMGGGWLDYEDPTDCLTEFISDENSDKELTAWVLWEYYRYCDIIAKITGKNILDEDLVSEAKAFLGRIEIKEVQ